MASNEEVLAIHKIWQQAIGEALTPLVSENDKVGLQALRVFYFARAKDGQETAGQIGITPEHRQKDGAKLVMAILTIMSDADKNWSVEKVEVTPKS